MEPGIYFVGVETLRQNDAARTLPVWKFDCKDKHLEHIDIECWCASWLFYLRQLKAQSITTVVSSHYCECGFFL